MSKIEKLVIPLISEYITHTDIDEKSGFVGFFTRDADNPTIGEFYLAYDDSVRSEQSIDRARRFDKCRDIKRKMLRTIDNKPLVVYVFWCKPTLKDINRCLKLTSSDKIRILQFWNFSDDTRDVFNLRYCQLQDTYLPAADYRPMFTDKLGLAA